MAKYTLNGILALRTLDNKLIVPTAEYTFSVELEKSPGKTQAELNYLYYYLQSLFKISYLTHLLETGYSPAMTIDHYVSCVQFRYKLEEDAHHLTQES